MFNESVEDIYKDRCRLCLDDSGVDVLHMKNKDKILELVSLASGIDIAENQLTPRKICEQCCVFALKLYSYRRCAAENDRLLKEIFNDTVTEKQTEILRKEKKSIDDLVQSNFSFQVQSTSLTHDNSNELIQNQCPIAKEKTKNKPVTRTETISKRKYNSVHSECMTRHKRKLKCMEEQRESLQKAELVNIDQLDSDARKYVFTSSLELVSTTDAFSKVTLNPLNKGNIGHKNDLYEGSGDLLYPSGKSDVVFSCNLCEQIFDCQKKLLTHQKKHLTCNICKKHSNTWKEYATHLQTSCYVSTTKPIVTLTRIDKEYDIVKKYPQAFETLQCKVPPYDTKPNIMADVKEENVKQEELVLEEYIEHVEQRSVDDDTITLKSLLYGSPSHATTNGDWLNVSEIVENVTAPHEQTSDNYCKEEVVEIVSNDPNENVPAKSVSQDQLHCSHKKSPDLSSPLVVNGKSSHNLADFRYKDKVVQRLFKKYTIKCEMKNANTGTLLPSASSIVYSPSALVTCQDLVKHLTYCKIPINFVKSATVYGSYYLKSPENQTKPEQSQRFDWSALSCTDFVTTANSNNHNINVLSKNTVNNQSSIPPTTPPH